MNEEEFEKYRHQVLKELKKSIFRISRQKGEENVSSVCFYRADSFRLHFPHVYSKMHNFFSRFNNRVLNNTINTRTLYIFLLTTAFELKSMKPTLKGFTKSQVYIDLYKTYTLNGSIQNNLLDGFVRIYRKKKLLCQGYFKEGLLEGLVILSHSEQVFIGHYSYGLRNGLGSVLSKNKYRGYFIIDRREGFGIEYNSRDVILRKGVWQGDVFVRDCELPLLDKVFQRNLKEHIDYEVLMLRVVNGIVRYEGEYDKNNKFDGEGKLFVKRRRKWYMSYLGEFRDAKYNGVGRMFDENNRLVFYGNFVNGVKKGSGIKIVYQGNKEKRIKGIWNGDNVRAFSSTPVKKFDLSSFKKIYYSEKRENYKIGEGAYSEVYNIDDKYAFKRFKIVSMSDTLNGRGMPNQFKADIKVIEREFKILSFILPCPNIIHVEGVSYEKNLVGIIMELCDYSVCDLILQSMKNRKLNYKKTKKKKKKYDLYIPWKEKYRIMYETCLGIVLFL